MSTTTTPAVFAPRMSPFDIAGMSAVIDRAAASLSPAERAALTVQANDSGIGAGVVVRLPLPLKPRIVAELTKPKAGRFGWSVSGRVSFLLGAPALRELRAVRLAPEIRGFYRLFRLFGNGRVASAAKAVAAWFGTEVRLHG